MAKNFWMVVQTPENHEISKGLGFTVHGMTLKQRKRAQRMEPQDGVLFYVKGIKKWTAVASITSKYFENRSVIWESTTYHNELYPFRVNMNPSIVMETNLYIDALTLAPRLDYLKRWPPEIWPLAFNDTLHLLPQKDFRLIESEMKRIHPDWRGRSHEFKDPKAKYIRHDR